MLHPQLQQHFQGIASSKSQMTNPPPDFGEDCHYAGIKATFISQSILHANAFILAFNKKDIPYIKKTLYFLNSTQDLPSNYLLVPISECSWINKQH